MPPPKARKSRRPWALTGTPGTGKSTVARLLPRRWRVIEVAELARRLGAARGRGRHVVVDLAALRRRMGRVHGEYDVLVGHLAHLLPVRGSVVLRCHPRELDRRLRRTRRGPAADRRANVVCEATDLVLLEAIGRGRPVVEVDTTGRTAGSVARQVARLLAHPAGPGARARTDWLADPWVTAHLLEAGP